MTQKIDDLIAAVEVAIAHDINSEGTYLERKIISNLPAIAELHEENKRLSNLVHEMEEQNMRQAITTHSYEPEEAKKMTEIEIALERLSDMARDYYLRDPQRTKSAMADIQIIRDALKQGRAKTMMLVEIAPGIEVFMTTGQRAAWEKLK